MIFSSPRFFVFLSLLLLVLSLPWRLQLKLHILLVASCLFYAAWDYRYVALLLFISVVNYVCGDRIHLSEQPGARRGWLALSVVASLGTLAYFKYCDFFITNVNLVLSDTGWALPHLGILLPAGISFYTFKTMSYTIDIYRREIEPAGSLTDYATFVTFFPELIAGPIVRASIFLPQMTRPIGPTAERLRAGLSIFLLGLTKKLLVADRLATVADPLFTTPALYSGPTLWLGVLAYTFQIYCDFSGYTDMAIGTAKMIGYDLPQNFHMPYLSADVAEFWRRWHITLSSWLRDYLYIPLGGNRRGLRRTYVNLMATMLLGGLWHGASWNFVAWGGLHGVALACHRAYRQWRGGRSGMPRVIAIPLTFAFVSVCWVPFRAPSASATWVMLQRMFTLNADGVQWVPTVLFLSAALVVLGHALGAAIDAAGGSARAHRIVATALSVLDADLRRDGISGWYVRFGVGTVPGSFVLAGWLMLIFFFAPTGTSPFIYFQF